MIRESRAARLFEEVLALQGESSDASLRRADLSLGQAQAAVRVIEQARQNVQDDPASGARGRARAAGESSVSVSARLRLERLACHVLSSGRPAQCLEYPALQSTYSLPVAVALTIPPRTTLSGCRYLGIESSPSPPIKLPR